MITKEYLLEKGFERDNTSPTSVEDFYRKEKPKGTYISVRFKGEYAVGLYAYSEDESKAIRKVVLSDTIIVDKDLEYAMAICRL